jgi:hypothetical protein
MWVYIECPVIISDITMYLNSLVNSVEIVVDLVYVGSP